MKRLTLFGIALALGLAVAALYGPFAFWAPQAFTDLMPGYN